MRVAQVFLGNRRKGEIFWGLDPWIYAFWAACVTLRSARAFYGAMLVETGGEWSAPLDDVFIHFDYARAITENHPFEWVAGNGYSSGNTSIFYPFVLAAGYAAGFRDQSLTLWAAIVATTSVWGTLLGARRLFLGCSGVARPFERDLSAHLTSYLLPAMLLGLGALDWSLWSGMEVAFFLAMWTLALLAYLALNRAEPSSLRSHAFVLGIAGAGIVATRPEGVTTVAIFALAAFFNIRHRTSVRACFVCLFAIAGPALFLLGLQALANRIWTGEASANGAIVKLAIYNPFLTPAEKFNDYVFNFKYAIFRNIEHHFADRPVFGAILPFLAFAGLGFRKSRPITLVLWGQIVLWLAAIALNGQVRWQNERYTMPAVAWLLMAAAIGAWQLAVGAAHSTRWISLSRVMGVTALLTLAAVHQRPKMADQIWFFGRASRNIRDQHLTAGRFLAGIHPERILVGDAGALIYASHARGLDIIGLGGYHDFPFARAGIHGLPATLELIERMPPSERPDLMAIYPTWWGVLPLWFTSGVVARFPVEGNVICGGYEKVIYAADWHTLDVGGKPRTLPNGEEVRDEIDVADLMSEASHHYLFPKPSAGWTDMKILPDPSDPSRDMFDGGRRIPQGRQEGFRAGNLTPNRPAHLIVRSAPEANATVNLRIDGFDVGEFKVAQYAGWTETWVDLPANYVRTGIAIELANTGPGDFIDYHVWVTQRDQ